MMQRTTRSDDKMSDLDDVLRLVPEDGTAIGNLSLQRELGWIDKRYAQVREALLAKGLIVKSPGRGGAVRRTGAVKDDERLVAVLPPDGSPLSKSKLLERLNWDEDRYYAARDRLVDTGQVVRGVGRGGTLRLFESPSAPEPRAGLQRVQPDWDKAVEREEKHYTALAKALKNDWAKDRGFTHAEVEITAKQGRRETGGRWSRPDLTAVSLTKYRYIPGIFLDVTTFEVKTIDGLDVTGVYEALAHRRSATRSYLLCIAEASKSSAQEERLALVEEEASRHGIGFFVIENAADYETWLERSEATRVNADPEKMNDFIARQLSGVLQQDVLEWLRG